MSESGLPIRAVSQMTGLSQHAIRAWEKRYGGIDPGRTDTNRRLYSREDIERLTLMKRASEQGHSLASVAALPLEAMRDLVGFTRADAPGTYQPQGMADATIAAMQALDADGLERNLDHALASFGADDAIDMVVIPLLRSIDEGWNRGSTTIAQEHLASAVLRSFLHRVRRSLLVPESGRRALFTTLTDELHELGALIAALLAAKRGWKVIYLGPNMPPSEIASAAKTWRASLVGLSIVSPRPTQTFKDELTTLRNALGPEVKIVLGGRSSHGIAAAEPDLGLLEIDNLTDLRRFLESPT